MIETFLHGLIDLIEAMGYTGVFILSALESTFVPIPSEATLIPAGYLVHQGKWNGPVVFILAILGTMTGSLLNYFIAKTCGRYLLIKYGKFFFINEEKMQKVENYFNRHGAVSIFLARLVMGIRHFISFPAGLANMNLLKFSFYTALGGGLWSLFLIVLGYELGNNQALVKDLMPEIKIGILVIVAVVAAIYWLRNNAKNAL